GAVNWMTAGKGVVHSERTPENLRNTDKNLHGLQIWVALPKELEQMDPSFHHINEDEIPSWEDGDLSFKLIAGEAMGSKWPVPVYSKAALIESKGKTRARGKIGAEPVGESALYIMEGSIIEGAHTYEAKQTLMAKDASL